MFLYFFYLKCFFIFILYYSIIIIIVMYFLFSLIFLFIPSILYPSFCYFVMSLDLYLRKNNKYCYNNNNNSCFTVQINRKKMALSFVITQVDFRLIMFL